MQEIVRERQVRLGKLGQQRLGQVRILDFKWKFGQERFWLDRNQVQEVVGISIIVRHMSQHQKLKIRQVNVLEGRVGMKRQVRSDNQAEKLCRLGRIASQKIGRGRTGKDRILKFGENGAEGLGWKRLGKKRFCVMSDARA